MSLLPNTILPPAMPFGRIQMGSDGKPTDFVLIEQNWFLFLYNISQNVLGSPGSGLSSTALIALESLEADADDADAIASRQGISNALVQSMQPQDNSVCDSDLPSIYAALQWGQQETLADVLPLAQPLRVYTVGVVSPFIHNSYMNGHMAVTGGTVTSITITRQGTTISTGLTTNVVPVSRGDIITVSFTAPPAVTFIPL